MVIALFVSIHTVWAPDLLRMPSRIKSHRWCSMLYCSSHDVCLPYPCFEQAAAAAPSPAAT